MASEAQTSPSAAASIRRDRLTRVQDLLRQGIDDGAYPGAVVCVYQGAECVLHEAVGALDGTRATATDSIYDLASLTKPLATAAVALTLAESGALLLSAALRDILGDCVPDHLAAVTLLQLLTHTSGLPAWAPCYQAGLGMVHALRAIFALPAPTAPPGARYEYSCLNFILLAEIVRRITGRSLDQLADEWIFHPLGVRDMTFRPPSDLLPRVAPTASMEGPAAGPHLLGVVHDGNARAIEAGGDISGNAGLFGTAAGVTAVAEAIRTGRLFGAPATVRALSNQIAPDIGGHSLLFYSHPNPLNPTGDLFSDRAVGHSGFTGTTLVIDPAYDLTVVVLTNSVFIDGKRKWLPLRRQLMNALAGALR